MKLKNEYWLHRMGSQRPGIGIHGDDDDESPYLKLAFYSDVDCSIDLNLHSLRELRDLINSVLEDHEDVAQCPACGYTIRDVKYHGDHNCCRNYPYFEWEKTA